MTQPNEQLKTLGLMSSITLAKMLIEEQKKNKHLNDLLETANSEVKALEKIDERNRSILRTTRSMISDRVRELEQVKAERDTALAYPTVDAYEKACEALWKHRAENESLHTELAAKDKVLEWYANEDNHYGENHCHDCFADRRDKDKSPVEIDYGYIARKVIKSYPPREKGETE